MKSERERSWLKRIWIGSILAIFIFGFLISSNSASFTVLGQMTGFTDLATAWANKDISDLLSANILSGYPDGSFRPEAPITRAEFAKMVVVAFSSPSETVPSFADVCMDYWASSYISRAQAQGWISGFPDGSFRPQDSLTRAQAISVLVRIAKWQPESWKHPVAASCWASDEVAAAWVHSVVQASDPYIDLQRPFADQIASRQEVAAFLNRTVSFLKTTPFLTQPMKTSPAQTEALPDQREQQLLTLLNRERQAKQLPAILLDHQLMEFAQSYAEEMGTTSFFSHDSPVSGSFQHRVCTLFDQGFTLVGENLGKAMDPGNKYTVEQIVENLHKDLMGSSSHRANILGNWTLAGLGFYQDGSLFLIVEVFGNR